MSQIINQIMKISIKTLQGKLTEFEVEETQTIADLKSQIEKQMLVEPGSQKLIHYGKILSDDTKKIVDCGIKDKDFIVLMITKVLY